MTLVDTHAHLDMEGLSEELMEVLERAVANKIKAIVTVGIDKESSRKAVEIASSVAKCMLVKGWTTGLATGTDCPSARLSS
ncbi:MAG: TatD family hydrolase [Desulfatiglandales bacterium]